jgi:hypothetical protein
MADNNIKIGVVSCSGEDCLGGTISRLATRKMLEELRPGETVTICLPLYLAGGEQERNFAKNFPTITVDGCSKLCAKKATEKFSGKVNAAVDVADIIGKVAAESGPLSTRNLTKEHQQMVDKVAQKVNGVYDSVLKEHNHKAPAEKKSSDVGES